MPETVPGNGLQSVLDGAIDAAATALTIYGADAPSWPASGTYRCILWNDARNGPFEVVTVTGGQGTDTLTVTRASEAFRGVQTAQPWPTGTNIAVVLTQAAFQALLPTPASSKIAVVDIDGEIGAVISFINIPQNFRHLMIVWRANSAYGGGTNADLGLRINDNTTAGDYQSQTLSSSGSGAPTSIEKLNGGCLIVGSVADQGSGAGVPSASKSSSGVIYLPDYVNPYTMRTVTAQCTVLRGGQQAGGLLVRQHAGVFGFQSAPTPLTKIELSQVSSGGAWQGAGSDWFYSIFTLYGFS